MPDDETPPENSSSSESNIVPIDDQAAAIEAFNRLADGRPELEALRPFMEKAGVAVPPDLAKSAPLLYLGRPLNEQSRQVAAHLAGRNVLFRRADSFEPVTAEENGMVRLMSAHRFRTWLPDIGGLNPVSGKTDAGEPKPDDMKVETAQTILANDGLICRLPELSKVNPESMPVHDDDLDERPDKAGKATPGREGFRKISLSPPGYHAPSKSFTVHQTTPFDENLDPKEAAAWFRNLLKYFEFGDDGRSMSVQLAAMLTVFCRRIFDGRSPLFVWNSNIGGSGKSRLSQLCLCSVFRNPESIGYDQRDQKELKSTLDTIAANALDYCRIDDFELPADVQMRSNHLNRFITEDTWGTRKFSTNTEMIRVELETTVMLTGVKLDLESQLQRRALWVDLFSSCPIDERPPLPADATMLTKPLLRNDEFRARLLSCLWAMVRSWDDAGRPPASANPKESFEEWCKVVPAIVEHCGFGDCLATFEAPDAGDTRTSRMRKLAEAVIRRYATGKGTAIVVTGRQVVKEARRHELFPEILGPVEQIESDLDNGRNGGWKMRDPDTGEDYCDPVTGVSFLNPEDLKPEQRREQALAFVDQKCGASWGKAWKGAVDGQKFTVAGEIWQFGKRGQTSKSSFDLLKVGGVDEPQIEAEEVEQLPAALAEAFDAEEVPESSSSSEPDPF